MTQASVLVGYPGAGKSTFYRKHLAATHVQVSRDLVPTNRGPTRRLEALVEEALAAGRSVAIDNTHPRRQDRAHWVDAGRRHGAVLSCYVLVATVKECLARNARREVPGRVPAVAVFTAARRFEPPVREEGFDRMYEVRLGERPDEGRFEVREVTKGKGAPRP